jgi:siroheme synthase
MITSVIVEASEFHPRLFGFGDRDGRRQVWLAGPSVVVYAQADELRTIAAQLVAIAEQIDTETAVTS